MMMMMMTKFESSDKVGHATLMLIWFLYDQRGRVPAYVNLASLLFFHFFTFSMF